MNEINKINQLLNSQDDEKCANNIHGLSASMVTADVATKMCEEYNEIKKSYSKRVPRVKAIQKNERLKLIQKAQCCFAWAHDPERVVVPGTENVTRSQVC